MRSTRTLIAMTAVLAGLVLLPPAASADFSFCTFGSGAGQCLDPRGVAVDPAAGPNGHVYVVDRGNNRINVFDVDGEFIESFGWGVDTGAAAFESCTTASGCQKGIAGSGAGQFSGVESIAVDPVSHDFYVSGESFRVQKFDSNGNFVSTFGLNVNKTKLAEGKPEAERNVCTAASGDLCGVGVEGKEQCQLSERDRVAVGPGGVLHVVDRSPLGSSEAAGFRTSLIKFSPLGACIERISVFEGARTSEAIAIDSSGNFYLQTEGTQKTGIAKYDPSGSLLYALEPDVQTNAIAVDVEDRLWAGQKDPGVPVSSDDVVTKYAPGGTILHRFGYAVLPVNIQSLSPFTSAEGDVFISEQFTGSPTPGNKILYLSEPPPGPIAVPGSVTAGPISNTKATLKAEVNPEGKATGVRFDYVPQEAFEESGFATAKSTPTKSPPPPFDGGFKAADISPVEVGCQEPLAEAAEGKCLLPETTYRFRVVATNADNPTGSGEGTVEGDPFTTKPPLELLATWSTEVGTDSATLNAQLNPLGIPTTGYFEYVDEAAYQADFEGGGDGFAEAIAIPNVPGGAGAIDFGSGEEPISKATAIFGLQPGTTYRYRLIAEDPLVPPIAGPTESLRTFLPPQSESCPDNAAFRTGPSALLPDCRAYELVSPLEKESGDVIPSNEATNEVPATLNQSSLSGSKVAYGSYRAFAFPESAPFTSQYISSRDSESGWQTHAIAPPKGELTLNVVAALDTEFKAFSPDLCNAWLRTVSEPNLTPDAVVGYPNIYQRSDQDCGAKAWEAITTATPPTMDGEGYYPLELQGLSADEQTAIYVAPDALPETGAPTIGAGALQLYEQTPTGELRFVCVLPNGTPSTSPCSGGTSGGGPGKSRGSNVFNAISADGSRIFWTASGTLGGPGQIYVRIEGSETKAVSEDAEALSSSTGSRFWGAADNGSAAIFTTGGDLYEFSVDTEETTEIAGEVPGLVGMSEDASRVYFVSSEAIPGSGQNSEGDEAIDGEPSLYLYEAGTGTSFIATLGALEAKQPAKGSTSAISIEPFTRATRVSPDGSHAAFMASTSPTGYDNTDAVSGKADAEVYLYDAEADELICASCNPSGARPVGKNIAGTAFPLWTAAFLPGWQNTLYPGRNLAEDGSRLYFTALDALVPNDTNGLADVYQWQEPASGSCEESSPTYSSQNQGCVDLVSSGQSARKAEFLDASPSGNDVFFATLESLLSHDYGLVDVYDARAEGGFPPPASLPPECEGEACQNPPPPPPLRTPASAAYQGPANPKPSARKPKRCAKGKRKVRRGGKVRCVPRKASSKPNDRRKVSR